jgi:hypothetical protein
MGTARIIHEQHDTTIYGYNVCISCAVPAVIDERAQQCKWAVSWRHPLSNLNLE